MADEIKYLDYTGVSELVKQIKDADTAIKNYAGDITGKVNASGVAYTSIQAYLEDEIAKAAEAGSAVNVSITDAGNYFTGANVEAALQEVGLALDTLGGGETDEGSIAKMIADKIGELKIGDTTVDDVVTYVNTLVGAVKSLVDKTTGDLTNLATAADDIVSAINAVEGKADDALDAIDGLGTAADADVATVEIGTENEVTTALPTVAQVKKYVTDSVANLEGATHFLGKFETLDGVENPVAGDIVLVGAKEYIYGKDNTWVEIGDETVYTLKTTTIAGVDLQNDITKEELLTALNVADGAQVNVLEGVQVNGADLTADGDKKVNITIAEGTANGTVKVNGSDVAVHGLGTAAYTDADAYDEAGAAADVQGDTTSTVKDVEDKVDAFKAITVDEIKALFAGTASNG